MSNLLNEEKLFGTDGVRGVANTVLSPQLAMRLGLAAAHLFGKGRLSPLFVVGCDSRISSPMLEAALSAGICAMGGEVFSPGLMTTPAVACVTRELEADAGIVISASHNPFPDNGIKFFGTDGYKLDDAIECELERLVGVADNLPRPSGAGVGHIKRNAALIEHYMLHLKQSVRGLNLANMKIVVDAGNGAASDLAVRLLSDLGADVVAMNCSPDGLNINANCGALHTQSMQQRVLDEKADLGVAFDGDADRAILCDEHGRRVDGDHILAICGIDLAKRDELPGSTVVGTVMSNMGLEVCLKERDITLLRTSVGDRYVSERMRRDGFVVGGEKSGHVIFGKLTTTGDGLLTALQTLKIMTAGNVPLSTLADVMSEYPQTLVNVRVTDRQAWQTDHAFQDAVGEAAQELEGSGRVNVRASGTEQLVRVMVEAQDDYKVSEVAGRLSDMIRERWGI